MALIKKYWKSFIALITAPSMVFLDQTILPVALPAIAKEFNANSTQLQWSVNAYTLAIAIFVLLGGKISDRIGHRKALSLGITGFALFSILCGVSPNIETLIVARGLQGISAAFIFPSQTALIADIFPPTKRGRATGIIVSIGSILLISGPLIGGYLTQVASWHWIFWINLPIAAFGLWMIFLFLPKSKPEKSTFDLLGFSFFAIGLGSLVMFFMDIIQWGITSRKSILLICLSILGFILLLVRERKNRSSFIDLTLFKHHSFCAVNINVAITQFILMITVFRTIYIQNILEYSPGQTGLITFVSAIPIFFTATFAGFLSDKFNPRVPIALGYLLLITSFFLFGFINTPSLPLLLIFLTIFGIGIPLIFTPSFASAILFVPPQKKGIAIGTIYTLRMIGASIGLALIHLFVSMVQKIQSPILGKRLAEISSFSKIHFALAFLLIVIFVLVFILYKKSSLRHPPEFPSEGWD